MCASHSAAIPHRVLPDHICTKQSWGVRLSLYVSSLYFPPVVLIFANCSESVWPLRANFNKLKLLTYLFLIFFCIYFCVILRGLLSKQLTFKKDRKCHLFLAVFSTGLHPADTPQRAVCLQVDSERVFAGWTCLKLNFPWSDSRLGDIWQCWLWVRFCFCFPLLPALDTFLLSGVSFEGLRKSPHCAPSGAAATRCSAPISSVLP